MRDLKPNQALKRRKNRRYIESQIRATKGESQGQGRISSRMFVILSYIILCTVMVCVLTSAQDVDLVVW